MKLRVRTTPAKPTTQNQRKMKPPSVHAKCVNHTLCITAPTPQPSQLSLDRTPIRLSRVLSARSHRPVFLLPRATHPPTIHKVSLARDHLRRLVFFYIILQHATIQWYAQNEQRLSPPPTSFHPPPPAHTPPHALLYSTSPPCSHPCSPFPLIFACENKLKNITFTYKRQQHTLLLFRVCQTILCAFFLGILTGHNLLNSSKD